MRLRRMQTFIPLPEEHNIFKKKMCKNIFSTKSGSSKQKS